MDPVVPPETSPEEQPLSEEECLREPVVEENAPQASRVIVPKKGKIFAEDDTCKIAVIRPCVSRGRRMRGNLPPIYTASMLAEYAHVFTNWPMFMDHLPPKLAEMLQERGRSVKELGGRIVHSWFDPDLVMEWDEEFDYQRGGVVARALPTPYIRHIVENDPVLLHTSINAFPKGGRPGSAYGRRGMLIEGIRDKPPGSVDWVIRGGAGGAVLTENEQRVVSLLESYYDAGPVEPDLKTMTPEQLREHVEEHAPHLLSALAPKASNGGTGAAGTGGGSGGGTGGGLQESTDEKPLTRAELAQEMREAQENFTRTLQEREEAIKSDGDKARATERQQTIFSREAHRIIEAAENLPAKWKADLKGRYSITPSGPSPALLVEAEVGTDGTETKSALDVLKEAVKADLEYSAELIAEATGRPVVKAQGQAGAKSEEGTSTSTGQKAARSWADELHEMGIVERDDKGALNIEPLLESIGSA